jgi:tetratricopeptide (TPR) repeat protein
MYEKAFAADSKDARILFEWDQLRKKLNDTPENRLELLVAHPDLCGQRDDLNIELAALYNVTGQAATALSVLEQRRFHPWEGGEGQVVLQYKSARIALGIAALKDGRHAEATAHFEKALTPPPNLGETYHPLQAKGDIYYWLGRAHRAQGDAERARLCFERCASERGDFQQMAVTEHSELSYYRGAALVELGQPDEARRVFSELDEFARRKKTTRAQIDYFATSLPLLLVFDDDLQSRNTWEADYLSALAQLGLRNEEGAAALLADVVAAHRAHAGARQFLSDLGRAL